MRTISSFSGIVYKTICYFRTPAIFTNINEKFSFQFQTEDYNLQNCMFLKILRILENCYFSGKFSQKYCVCTVFKVKTN